MQSYTAILSEYFEKVVWKARVSISHECYEFKESPANISNLNNLSRKIVSRLI